jgi:hypothetical protein
MGNKTYPKVFPHKLVVKAESFPLPSGIPDQVIQGSTSGYYVRSGINNPNWKRTLLAGGNASSPLTVDIDEAFVVNSSSAFLNYSTYPFSQTQQHSTYGTRPPPAGFAYPNNLTEWEDEVRVKASKGFLKRLREQDHKFQGGVFFGEIVPTLRMLKRPFGSLRDGLKNYFRKQRANGSGYYGPKLRAIMKDTWLEFAFGWQPLLSDIKDASAAAINVYANLRRSRVNQVAGDELSLPTQVVRNYQENLMKYDVYFSNDIAYSVKYYGGLLPLPNADKGLPFLQRIVDMSGFNLASFIPTVWELVPYSFLIDYFSNVNDVLDAYYTDTSQLAWLSMVEKRLSGQTIRWDYLHSPTYKNIVGSQQGFTQTRCGTSGVGSTYGSRHTQIMRWSHGALTYGGLRFTLPTDLKKFVNMGALLLGMRRMS